jgi:hypothetical protein
MTHHVTHLFLQHKLFFYLQDFYTNKTNWYFFMQIQRLYRLSQYEFNWYFSFLVIRTLLFFFQNFSTSFFFGFVTIRIWIFFLIRSWKREILKIAGNEHEISKGKRGSFGGFWCNLVQEMILFWNGKEN